MFLLFVVSLLFFSDLSSACCCTVTGKLCGCNIFNCNCDTVVMIDDDGFAVDGWCQCFNEEFCPDRRRRKRSLHEAISEAYSELYPNYLIEQGAMENFFSFDRNLDGLISLEEAIVANNNGSNKGFEEGFKQVDLDNDGFVKPSEFDSSLC